MTTKDPVFASIDNARWYREAGEVIAKARNLPHWFLRAGELALEKDGPYQSALDMKKWMLDKQAKVAPFGPLRALEKAIAVTEGAEHILVRFESMAAREDAIRTAQSILEAYGALTPAVVYSVELKDLLSGPDDTLDDD
jgi:hypothetical protein